MAHSFKIDEYEQKRFAPVSHKAHAQMLAVYLPVSLVLGIAIGNGLWQTLEAYFIY